MKLCKSKLYDLNFTKVHKMNPGKLTQLSKKDGTFEFGIINFGFLNTKGVHALKFLVNGMNLSQISCSMSLLICEACIEGQHIRAVFTNDRERHANNPWEITHLDVFHHMRNVAFIDHNISIGSDLEMRTNGRNDVPMVVGMDKVFQTPLFCIDEDIEEREEQLGDFLIAFQKLRG